MMAALLGRAGDGLIHRKGEAMARVIPFHIPGSYKPTVRWIPKEQRGRIIEFRTGAARKSA